MCERIILGVLAMSTIYALYAEQCVELSMKTKVLSDRLRLLRLAREWQQVAAEQHNFRRTRDVSEWTAHSGEGDHAVRRMATT